MDLTTPNVETKGQEAAPDAQREYWININDQSHSSNKSGALTSDYSDGTPRNPNDLEKDYKSILNIQARGTETEEQKQYGQSVAAPYKNISDPIIEQRALKEGKIVNPPKEWMASKLGVKVWDNSAADNNVVRWIPELICQGSVAQEGSSEWVKNCTSLFDDRLGYSESTILGGLYEEDRVKEDIWTMHTLSDFESEGKK